MKMAIIVFLAACICIGSAFSEEKQTLVIFDIEASSGFSGKENMETIHSLILEKLIGMNRYRVLSRKEIDSMMPYWA